MIQYQFHCEMLSNRFSVEKRIFIVGFGLYGSIHGAREYDAKIQVLLPPSGKVCGTNSARLTCDGSGYTFRVMFKEPIEIRPYINYIASATIQVICCLFNIK